MTLTARKHAWLNRIAPAARHMAGLNSIEIALVLSWTFLADILLSLLSGSIILLFPLSYFLASTILAWLEHSGSRIRLNCPLQAFGLAEVTLEGGRPTQWQTLRRLFFTPPLLMLAGAAFLPIPGRSRTLLQWISGTRIVPLDTALDPRTDTEVSLARRKARLRVLAYLLSSLLAATIVFLMPPDTGTTEDSRTLVAQGLPEQEAILLTGYLEMAAVYPDSIEFHVRLASLYYRNGMLEDLTLELERISQLDPYHPMLLLGQDLDVTFNDILVQPDTLDTDTSDVILETPIAVQEPAPVDSTSALSEDSASVDSTTLLEDTETLPSPADTTDTGELLPPLSDSTAIVTDDTLTTELETDIDSLALVPSPLITDTLPDMQSEPALIETNDPVVDPQDSEPSGMDEEVQD